MPLLDLDKYTQQMFVKYFFEAIFSFVCAYSTSKPICSITCHLEVLVNENRILGTVLTVFDAHTTVTQFSLGVFMFIRYNAVIENQCLPMFLYL